jgi:TonB family protein
MRALLFFLVLVSAVAAQDRQTSRELLNQGVQAFKNARYAEAVNAFQKAVEADPAFTTAWLYLGTAYMQQYIPGADAPEDQNNADKADAAFQRALQGDPANLVALSSLASLNLNRKRWDSARSWYKQLLNVDPNNAEAYYSTAFADWAQWYPAYGQARTKAGMAPAQPGPIPDPAVRAALRSQWWPTLEDGIWNLNRALEINPKYSDAMAYMNLFLRERADLQDTPQQYQQDVRDADQWVQRAIEARKDLAAQPGITGAPPPPPPPPAPAGAAQRLRVSNPPEPVSKIDPAYPPLARQALIQGTVRLNAVLDKQGHVTQLQVLSGHPLLVPAALEAVRQWVYPPTLLNGDPVEVQTEIAVKFTLPR